MIIYTSFILIMTALLVYCYVRMNKVHNFIAEITNIWDKGMMTHVGDWKYFHLIDRFADPSSTDKMLFSFKPLKMEYWFTKEEIELLMEPGSKEGKV